MPALVNKALHIFLAFLLICQSFSSLFIVAGYEINKDFITKNICVNKNKPSLHCNGKCHLKKELSKDSESETGTKGPQKEKSETLTLFPFQAQRFAPFMTGLEFCYFTPAENIIPGFSYMPERPPAA